MAKQLSYILLGDGDFTYSLDMCRYLAAAPPSSPSSSAANSGDGNKPTISNITHLNVTCTGVDTFDEVKSKYKDADFILKNIKSFNNKYSGNTEEHLSTESRINTMIVHGLNAVQPIINDCSSLRHFDHVLFHHPHLGIEDAQLHKRFLLHFFHAASQRWMRPNGGLLYLTLVRAQCERWDCISGAERHGLMLLRRGKFCPPPPPTSKEKTYYQLRRHQSGKSFANRRIMQGEKCGLEKDDGESETLVFGRRCDYPLSSSLLDGNVGMLPWENVETLTSSKLTEWEEAKRSSSGGDISSPAIATSPSSDDPYSCIYCNKSFLEQRSLKNHIICSHPDCDEAFEWATKKKGKKRKLKGSDNLPHEQQQLRSSGEGLVCKICESQKTEDEPTRVFPHKQALLDHERAKHSGVHLDIKPDWYKGGEENFDGVGEKDGNLVPPSNNSCPICDIKFSSMAERIRHEQDFVPIATTTDSSAVNGASQTSFKCSYCSKSFREERAKRQHENFCSSKAASRKLLIG
ncbi:hypothetical protein ACHAXM_001881 [Skeletonema potamos]